MEKTERLNTIRREERDDYDVTDSIRFEKNSVGKLLLRINIGGLMLFHGVHKLIHGTDDVGRILSNVGLPVFFSFGVLIGEVVGPILVLLGYKVRLGAFLVAFNMFMAILLVHASDIFAVSGMGGWMIELNALYFLGALSIMFLGSGRFSLSKGAGALD
jgi:putative oxidoreductase